MNIAPPPRPGPLHRLLPRPWTAAWLWVAWLLLNQTLAPGHLLLGLVLAVLLARLGGPAPPSLRDPGRARSGARRPGIVLRLVWTVVYDIVVANLQVARRILGRHEALEPRFVWVPLEVRRPRSISLLAGIVTMTPGTVSAELSDDHRHLLVHGLDIADPDALVAEIKSRYEAPIRELFE